MARQLGIEHIDVELDVMATDDRLDHQFDDARQVALDRRLVGEEFPGDAMHLQGLGMDLHISWIEEPFDRLADLPILQADMAERDDPVGARVEACGLRIYHGSDADQRVQLFPGCNVCWFHNYLTFCMIDVG